MGSGQKYVVPPVEPAIAAGGGGGDVWPLAKKTVPRRTAIPSWAASIDHRLVKSASAHHHRAPVRPMNEGSVVGMIKSKKTYATHAIRHQLSGACGRIVECQCKD